MTHHLLQHVRRNAIPYLVCGVVLALGVGGGYAYAASKTKTITVCADKGTGVLHLHNHGKCKRGQTRVTWNQKGPQGAQGTQGPAGAPGAPAVSVWAQVTNAGLAVLGPGSLGPACLGRHVPGDDHRSGVRSRIQRTGDHRLGHQSPRRSGARSGAFPVAWYQSTGSNQVFNVFTGVVVGGSFTPTDHAFTVMDSCM